MLHGLSRNVMFSYGFWTDNMNAELDAAFKKQMDDDARETTGVIGEYRNDTHLSMIMQPEEIRVVVRVSEETFNEWQKFVTSDKGVVRYTFHPGFSDAGHQDGLDNCVSFAFLQMMQFINNNEKELKKQDLDALDKMQKYIQFFQAKMKDRYEKTRNRSGLQGVLMGVTNAFDDNDDEMVCPEYVRADGYTGLIYGDIIKEMAIQDSRDMKVQPDYENVKKLAECRVPLFISSGIKTQYDNELLSAYVKLYIDTYLEFCNIK